MELFKKYFVSTVTKKYIAFDGKADRAEFWYYILFASVISLILGLIFAPLAALFDFAILLPSLSIAARRLRDAGFSPLWLLTLFFGVGIFIVLGLCAMPSKQMAKK